MCINHLRRLLSTHSLPPLFLCVLWFFCDISAFPVTAATFYVPAEHGTIQEAIDASTHGDEIVVATGTYFERIHFDGKNIVLRSTDPTDLDVVSATVIDASASYDDESSVVTFSGSEGGNCVLAGFTIQKGDTFLGGGIRGNRTGARIEWNHITENEATTGAGIHECDGTIRNNRIHRNRAVSAYVQGFSFDGDGGALGSCDGAIYNNLIYDNRASGHGGAFYDCNAFIEFNTMYSNDASYGTGFYNCNASISNNIIWEYGSTSIYGSGTPVYCCIRNWSGGGRGNLSTDPRFVDVGSFDFRLRPDSPCIDAGGSSDIYPDSDIDNATRPYDATSLARGDGSDFDMGAYEFIGEAEPNPRPNRPVNVSPVDATDVIGYNPLLVSSPFSDPDPTDVHVRSEWQVCENDGFALSDLVSWNWSDEDEILQIEALLDPKQYLQADRTYWWRVRHLDTYEQWSEWSLATSFNTRPATEPLRVPQDYSTIQSAIDHGVDGGVIAVATGTYRENLDFREKGIALRSTDPLDATVVAQTVFKYSSWHKPAILFENIRYDSRATLSGLTIDGGGQGILCNGINVDIFNNVFIGGPIHTANDLFMNNRIEGGPGLVNAGNNIVIEGNTILSGGIEGSGWGTGRTVRNNLFSGIDGTAITKCHGPIQGNTITHCTGRAITSCNGLIEGNTIMWNQQGAIEGCDGTISGNLIAFNTAGNSPGIIECDGHIVQNIICNNWVDGNNGGAITSCDGLISNNLVYNNRAESSGSIGGCDGVIVNNTVVFNHADLWCGGILLCNGTILNNIVWGNTASEEAQFADSSVPSFSCIQDWTGGGEGNISLDPQFIDPANGDFHLLSTSPCIDAGAFLATVTEDYWGDLRGLDGVEEERGDGSNYDIGADEFLGKQLFHLGSDIDLSGWVDVLDLLIFLPDWHSSTGSNHRSDINNDSMVNPVDLRILMNDWYRGTRP